MVKTVCVFCASSEDLDEIYYRAATQLGVCIASNSMNIIHGGGMIGMMGRLSKAALESGATVTGVVPETLNKKGIVSEYDTHTVVTPDMMQRKHYMRSNCDAFIAMPGGFGTLEEILEVITLKQLKYHEKPIVLLNINSYFDMLIAQFEKSYSTGFALPQYKKLFYITPEIDLAIEYIKNYRHENLYDKYLKS